MHRTFCESSKESVSSPEHYEQSQVCLRKLHIIYQQDVKQQDDVIWIQTIYLN